MTDNAITLIEPEMLRIGTRPSVSEDFGPALANGYGSIRQVAHCWRLIESRIAATT
jgi:hypothetical protein